MIGIIGSIKDASFGALATGLIAAFTLPTLGVAAFFAAASRSRKSNNEVAGLTTSPVTVTSPSEARELRGERYRPRASDQIIELLYARPDPRQGGPNIVYRRKLRVALRNITGYPLEVKAADWISSNGYIPFQPPFYSILQEENVAAGGYVADKWKDEEKLELTVSPNTAFLASIGLDQSFSVEDIDRRLPTRRVGMLALPLIIDGEEIEWRRRL